MQASSFYRVQKVAEIFGASTASIWRWTKERPDFPKPVKVSERVTGWLSEEIDQYKQARIAASRAGGSQ